MNDDDDSWMWCSCDGLKEIGGCLCGVLHKLDVVVSTRESLRFVCRVCGVKGSMFIDRDSSAGERKKVIRGFFDHECHELDCGVWMVRSYLESEKERRVHINRVQVVLSGGWYDDEDDEDVSWEKKWGDVKQLTLRKFYI